MTWWQTTIVVVLGAAALASAAHWFGRERWGHAYAWSAAASQTHRYWPAHGRWGCHGEGGHERLGAALAYARESLGLSVAQEPAWRRLVGAVETAAAKFREACRPVGPRDRLKGAEALAALETWLAGGLEAVRALRPAFETFYAMLDDEQRQRLDEMMARRHRS